MLVGAGVGARLGAPATTEALHLAYTELVRETRPLVPKITESPALGSVAFGVWPDQNKYREYSKKLGLTGQTVGFFVSRDLNEEDVNKEIIKAQEMGKTAIISCSWNVRSSTRFREYLSFAKKLKRFPEPFFLRPNYEANQHTIKRAYGIRHPEEFVAWWEEFYSIIMNEGVNCKFIYCANSTEDIINTDPIELYAPTVGVSTVAIDTYQRYHSDPFDIKHILPNFSALEQIGHDVAVLQKLFPNVPFAITEFGSEENQADFKRDIIEIAPYLDAILVKSFDWKKINHGPDEIDWRTIRDIAQHRAVKSALNNIYYLPDHMPSESLNRILLDAA